MGIERETWTKATIDRAQTTIRPDRYGRHGRGFPLSGVKQTSRWLAAQVCLWPERYYEPFQHRHLHGYDAFESLGAASMNRRAFIVLVGGAAAWALRPRAQQPNRMRRIGVLYAVTEDNVEGQARRAAFLQALQELGWTDGRNVRIDYRWGATDAELGHKYAANCLRSNPMSS